MIEIVPSILSADLLRLGDQVEEALVAGARSIHVDVMDGHFVPEIAMGPGVVAALHPLAVRHGASIEAHLMVEEPDRHIEEVARAGASCIIVHFEACRDLHRTVAGIWRRGVRAGVALSPTTSIASLDELLGWLDLVLVMSVEPGAGGQAFLPNSLGRVARVRRRLDARGLRDVDVAVDGGVHVETLGAIVRAGATRAVAGSAVFTGPASVTANLIALRTAAQGLCAEPADEDGSDERRVQQRC